MNALFYITKLETLRHNHSGATLYFLAYYPTLNRFGALSLVRFYKWDGTKSGKINYNVTQLEAKKAFTLISLLVSLTSISWLPKLVKSHALSSRN